MKYEIFANKSCFISGATGGIGSQIALTMAQNGCNLFLTSTNTVELSKLGSRIQDLCHGGNKVFYEKGDLNKTRDVARIIKSARKNISSIDIVVNCAGVFTVKDFSGCDADDFQETFNVNVRAAFMFSRDFSRDMVRKKWGRIINIGSSSAYAGCKRTVLYCASKHALLGFSRALHDELKQYNVRTFCISPSGAKTRMGKRIENQDYDTFLEPREIAEYVAFAASFDGGMVSDELRLNRMEI